uniref:NPF receptor n=1 Tax=Haliotis discus hannai TaxID=42344 RepID=A0A8T9VSY9_HALDH|nr:NPF receptor [Haliotis discus hannai]
MDMEDILLNVDFENMSSEEIQQQFELYSNFSQDIKQTDWDILKDKRWQVVVIILYVVVIVFGFLGNLVVVIVIAKYKQLHTVTNIFIANLAVADIALCVFNLPFQLHYQLTDTWTFGSILCHITMPTFGVPIFVSSLSILSIAVDRYILIVFPFTKRMTNVFALGVVVVIGCVTTGLAIPLMVYTRVEIIDEPLFKLYQVYCVENWPSYKSKRAYAVTVFVLQFCIPLMLTTFFYTHICAVLKNRPIKRNETRRNQRTTKILIAVVLTFTLCWLPWNIFSLTAEFHHSVVRGKYFKLIDLLLKIFAMSSSCINPFLYGWLNDNFRKELGRMVGHQNGFGRVNNTNGYSLAQPTKKTNLQQSPRIEMDRHTTPY